MPVAADYQAQILREVGDPNTSITPLIATLWGLWDDKTGIGLELQYLYTKRAALDIRLKEQQPDTDITLTGELSDRQSQRFDHLQQMRDAAQMEITRLEGKIRANRGGASGAITTIAPESNPVTGSRLDANDPRYAGDPYYPLVPPS
jgi:hypothetical protein